MEAFGIITEEDVDIISTDKYAQDKMTRYAWLEMQSFSISIF